MKTTVFNRVYTGIMDIMVVPTDFCENPKLLKAALPSVIDYDKKI